LYNIGFEEFVIAYVEKYRKFDNFFTNKFSIVKYTNIY